MFFKIFLLSVVPLFGTLVHTDCHSRFIQFYPEGFCVANEAFLSQDFFSQSYILEFIPFIAFRNLRLWSSSIRAMRQQWRWFRREYTTL